MANPDISLLGATYPEVSGVTLPVSGGGTATFPWVEGSQTITTNNTYDVSALAQVVVNVSGGGGASNIVTGTFKGTTTGAAMDVTLNYTGSGYPIAINVYPTQGFQSGSEAYDVIASNGVLIYSAIKRTAGTPTYQSASNDNDKYVYVRLFKNSPSSASSVTNSSSASITITNGATAAQGSSAFLKFKNARTMSVYIASGTQSGFIGNISYTYYVIYSS